MMSQRECRERHPTFPVALPREYPPAPLVGVAAVVLNDAGQVLLVERGRAPSKGLWGLPGGLLDLGERMVDGVRREVMEECGVQIEVGGLVEVFEPIQRDEDGHIRYHYVVVDYWARYLSGKPIANDDAADVAWVEPTSLQRLPMLDETRQVIARAVALCQAERSGT